MNDDRERLRSQSPADSGSSAPPDNPIETLFDRDGHLPAETLSRFLDEPESFPAVARDEVEWHLATCETCRTTLADLQSIVLALHALPQVEPRRSFALSPAQATRPAARGPQLVVLHETPQWVERWLPRVRSAAAVAAVLFVLVLAADVVSSLGGTGDDDDDAGIEMTSRQSTTGGAAQATATTAGGAAAPTPAAGNDLSATATEEMLTLSETAEQEDQASLAAEAPTEATPTPPAPQGTPAAPEATTTSGEIAQPTPASQATTGSSTGEPTATTAAAQATPTAPPEATATTANAFTMSSTETPTVVPTPTTLAQADTAQETEEPVVEPVGALASDDDGGRDNWRLIELGLALMFIWMLAALIALPRLTRRAGK